MENKCKFLGQRIIKYGDETPDVFLCKCSSQVKSRNSCVLSNPKNIIHEIPSVVLMPHLRGKPHPPVSYQACDRCRYYVRTEIEQDENGVEKNSEKIGEILFPSSASSKKSVDMPTLFQQARNLTWALLRWGRSGFRTRSEADIEKILEICKGCQFYNAVKQRCSKCGCNCNNNNLVNKIALASESCPEGKW